MAELSDAQLAAQVDALADEPEALMEFLALVDAREVLAKQAPVDMLASALFYAQRLGWPVFPCERAGKRPRTAHGFHDATLDVDRITRWFGDAPRANLATPTGADGCGYDVWDFDGRIGTASLAAIKHADCPPGCSDVTFCRAQGVLVDTVARAVTPGDENGAGFHCFVPSEGAPNATALAPGVDYRGAGGYVLLPPSLGANGVRYSWAQRPPLPG